MMLHVSLDRQPVWPLVWPDGQKSPVMADELVCWWGVRGRLHTGRARAEFHKRVVPLCATFSYEVDLDT